jgi:hypothetical protein
MKLGAPSYWERMNIMRKIQKFEDKFQGGCMTIHTTDSNASLASFVRGDEAPDLLTLGNIGLMKIDVEGAELDVIIGMEGILKTHKPLLRLEINPVPGKKKDKDHEALYSTLEHFGYTRWTFAHVEKPFDKTTPIDMVPNISTAKDVLFF